MIACEYLNPTFISRTITDLPPVVVDRVERRSSVALAVDRASPSQTMRG